MKPRISTKITRIRENDYEFLRRNLKINEGVSDAEMFATLRRDYERMLARTTRRRLF